MLKIKIACITEVFMNKNNVLKLVVNKIDLQKGKEELIRDIEKAIIEMEIARAYFESVSDSKLIDYAIYMEEAAKARYAYLLSEAKRLNIRNTNYYISKEMRII